MNLKAIGHERSGYGVGRTGYRKTTVITHRVKRLIERDSKAGKKYGTLLSQKQRHAEMQERFKALTEGKGGRL